MSPNQHKQATGTVICLNDVDTIGACCGRYGAWFVVD